MFVVQGPLLLVVCIVHYALYCNCDIVLFQGDSDSDDSIDWDMTESSSSSSEAEEGNWGYLQIHC